MARIDGESSDHIDPLADYSSLSLFPRSFTSLHNSTTSIAGSVCPHLKSMVLRSPENLLKQAKTVLDDSLNLFKNDKTSAMASEDKTDAVFITNEKNHQVKRPGLGLKQAKFSAKPMPRQLDTMTEPTIDIDKLEDPVKFFEAYERMENAKKEIRKLRGEPLHQFDQNISYLPPRRKRPSLMGKSATYKHQSFTSKATDDSNKALLSSEETFVNHTVSPVRRDLQSKTDDLVMLPNTKVHDSTTSKTWKDGDLNKLLSCDYDALDAAEVVNLLQEKLNVKVRDLGKLSIPNFCDVRPRKSLSSTEAFSKITDSTSHLNAIRKAIHGDLLSTGSQSNESNVQLTKSPLASMSLLNRHSSELALWVDTFSATDIELSLDKRSSETQNGKQGDARMEMYGSHRSLVNAEESSAVDRRVLSVNGIAPSRQAEDQLAEVGQSGQVGTTEQLQDIQKSKVQIEENSAGCGRESLLSVRKRDATNVGQPDWMERTENLSEIVRSPENFYDRVADPCSDFIDFAARDNDPTYEGKEKENEVGKDVDSVCGKLNIEKSTINEAEVCELGQASITESILSKELTKKTRADERKIREKKSKVSTQASPNETMNEEMEANTQPNAIDPTGPRNKKRKQIVDAPVTRKQISNRRSSLYVAGMRWEAGVRRSSRIRMRPLEYWKGERFLYGRVHNSLVTVIGVKYASPSKEAEEPRIKVKSFVSDEHKDKLEGAALY